MRQISAVGRLSRGELLFTDYGLSGIAAMEISADIAKRQRLRPSKRLSTLPVDGGAETADFPFDFVGNAGIC